MEISPKSGQHTSLPHPGSSPLLAAMVLLIAAFFTLSLAAQSPSPHTLGAGIERARRLSTSELDARIAHLSPSDHDREIVLRFARLQNSVESGTTATISSDAQRILAAADALRNPARARAIYARLAEVLSQAAGVDSTLNSSNQLHQQQLRVAQAERLSAQRQIAALRAQGELIAAEKMRQQLIENQRNQQLQLTYITRRSQLQSFLSILLLVCLLLAIALAWSLWRINLARRQQALEDPLTGLKNRRFLAPFMEHETLRLRRSGLTALILMADIDHFKSVNDRWGHEVGDQALIQFAGTLRNCMRDSDVVARWGGEEFLVVCPQSTEKDAELICNRIRQRLQQTPIATSSNNSFFITVSIGAALFSPATQDEHWEAALARADRALYWVKQNGRDNWSLAGEPRHAAPSKAAIL